MDSIVLLYDKGKIIRGKITYYEDWYDKWKSGEPAEIYSIEFNEGETPEYLSKEDIQKSYDQADQEFKKKMGVSYEEFCAAGKPTYEQVMKEREKQDELRFKQIQCGVRPNNNPTIRVIADTEKIRQELEELKKKIDELNVEEEQKKYKRGLRREAGIIDDDFLGYTEFIKERNRDDVFNKNIDELEKENRREKQRKLIEKIREIKEKKRLKKEGNKED